MLVVVDTNVLVAALHSADGASHEMLRRLPWQGFQPVLSVPLYLEYQAVLQRPGMLPPDYTAPDILAFCRQFAAYAVHQDIFYLWRPVLPDPGDDLLLELSVAAQARYIVTHNARHLRPAAEFGVTPLTPADFLQLLPSAP